MNKWAKANKTLKLYCTIVVDLTVTLFWACEASCVELVRSLCVSVCVCQVHLKLTVCADLVFTEHIVLTLSVRLGPIAWCLLVSSASCILHTLLIFCSGVQQTAIALYFYTSNSLPFHHFVILWGVCCSCFLFEEDSGHSFTSLSMCWQPEADFLTDGNNRRRHMKRTQGFIALKKLGHRRQI